MSVIINIHSKYYYHFYIAFLHAISNYFYNARFFIHWILIHGIYYSHKGLNDKITPQSKHSKKNIYVPAFKSTPKF